MIICVCLLSIFAHFILIWNNRHPVVCVLNSWYLVIALDILWLLLPCSCGVLSWIPDILWLHGSRYCGRSRGWLRTSSAGSAPTRARYCWPSRWHLESKGYIKHKKMFIIKFKVLQLRTKKCYNVCCVPHFFKCNQI
jgi:hypothetical protein